MVASCIDFYVVLLLIFRIATYDKTLLTWQSNIGGMESVGLLQVVFVGGMDTPPKNVFISNFSL